MLRSIGGFQIEQSWIKGEGKCCSISDSQWFPVHWRRCCCYYLLVLLPNPLWTSNRKDGSPATAAICCPLLLCLMFNKTTINMYCGQRRCFPSLAKAFITTLTHPLPNHSPCVHSQASGSCPQHLTGCHSPKFKLQINFNNNFDLSQA